MAKPFRRLFQKDRSLLQKVTGRLAKENAVVQINNLLADSPSVTSVQEDEVHRIASLHKLSLGAEFVDDFCSLYEAFCVDRAAAGNINDSDASELAYLRNLLRIPEVRAEDAFIRAVTAEFRKAVDVMLSDSYLSDTEKAELADLRKRLRIPDTAADKVYLEIAGSKIQRYFDLAIADGEMSPEEEETLERLGKNFDIDLKHSEKARRVIEDSRRAWQISHGRIEPITVPILLTKGEFCFASVVAEFHETRKVTLTSSRVGVRASYRLFKGVRIYADSARPARQTEDALTMLDAGILYLTNKRLLFMGVHRNITIKMSSVLSVTRYSDGIEVEKGAGKNAFFIMHEETALFARMVDRIMGEQ